MVTRSRKSPSAFSIWSWPWRAVITTDVPSAARARAVFSPTSPPPPVIKTRDMVGYPSDSAAAVGAVGNWLGIACSDELKSQGIQFGVGLFPDETKDLFRVVANGRADWWRHLLDQLDHPVGGRLGAQAGVLHGVEHVAERAEDIAIECALLAGHGVCQPLQGGCRLRGSSGAHVAG